MPVGAFPLRPRVAAVALDHLLDEIRKARLVAPAELLTRLSRIAQQQVDLGRTEISRIDLDKDLSGLGIDPSLVDAAPPPADCPAHMLEDALTESLPEVL